MSSWPPWSLACPSLSLITQRSAVMYLHYTYEAHCLLEFELEPLHYIRVALHFINHIDIKWSQYRKSIQIYQPASLLPPRRERDFGIDEDVICSPRADVDVKFKV
ncbi:hypothetical protein GALMADRAFT_744458 [Galerina marginata CBS 339.88]|uniref:Uncharacterized protein n=1 Tax=Galerina marginata (strain CBS 339.88) TaxID=685588 RepID=A0A067T1X8_GALM3|nr:hypothetical protein GALMADRAFT_744458 [Galerina marginata CBS 339.88]